MSERRRIDVVLFDDFELLDVAGPVELLTADPDLFDVGYLTRHSNGARCSQGLTLTPDRPTTAREADILLVPGGSGTRALVDDTGFLQWLRELAASRVLVASVCTGSALLAAAGLLQGYRATSNKRAFDWASGYGGDVRWVRQARWVVDRDRWTSSGVAAGMDMTAALIRDLHGSEAADEVLDRVELEVQSDPTRDRFAPIP